ncbi:MAG: pentapeptide repeat-containing protein [Oligoflexia bacterium]|nr:pentapeptide repeat-containing protein [Oligoflexia bacterium]
MNLDFLKSFKTIPKWAPIKKTDLQESDMRWTCLEKANLYEANLFNSNLSQANLSRSILEEANLEATNLKEAYMEGVRLGGATVKRAKLPKEWENYIKERLNNNGVFTCYKPLRKQFVMYQNRSLH